MCYQKLPNIVAESNIYFVFFFSSSFLHSDSNWVSDFKRSSIWHLYTGLFAPVTLKLAYYRSITQVANFKYREGKLESYAISQPTQLF